MDLLKSIFKGDKVIWIIFMFLCLISIIEVFSASSTLTYKSGDHWGPITQHSIFLMIGTVVVVFFHNIPYRWFQVLPVFMLPISVVLLIVVMFMEKVNDAARFIPLFGFQFQPSEFAKMAVVIATAFILSKGQTEEGANPKAFKHIMWITTIICGLIFPENFSTAALLFGTVFLMMFIGRVAMRKLFMLAGVLVGIAIVGILALELTKGMDLPLTHRFDTWRTRIEKFASNEKVPAAKFDTDRDGQIGHARIAVATSNVLGKGPGNSVQRDFLSQAYSDFIYAIVIEELGLVGGTFVAFLYIILLIRAGRIAKKCGHSFPTFLVLGIALLLVTQALFNMMVAVGIAPVTGQPLPLISRGGTSTIINCVYIGMILSVSRYAAALEEERKRQEAEQRLLIAQREHDAQIPLLIDGLPDSNNSQAQSGAQPTAKIFNSDTEFEIDEDDNNNG